MHRVCRRVGDEIIIGKSLPAFIHNGGTYFLTQIEVYPDGTIECWGHVTLEEFEQKVGSGWVVTSLPEYAEVHIHHLATFRAKDVISFVQEGDLLKEVRDIIAQFQGYPSLSKRCLDAFFRYLDEPTQKNREQLQEAYTAIPLDLRMYILGDQDVKDKPIRTILEQDVSMEMLQWMKEQYRNMKQVSE
jgi:hypothetical protein